MESCFSWCCVPPSHKTAWMQEVPRASLPTPTGTTVSLAASTILDPCFYTPGAGGGGGGVGPAGAGNPSQEIHLALSLPTQPGPKLPGTRIQMV